MIGFPFDFTISNWKKTKLTIGHDSCVECGHKSGRSAHVGDWNKENKLKFASQDTSFGKLSSELFTILLSPEPNYTNGPVKHIGRQSKREGSRSLAVQKPINCSSRRNRTNNSVDFGSIGKWNSSTPEALCIDTGLRFLLQNVLYYYTRPF